MENQTTLDFSRSFPLRTGLILMCVLVSGLWSLTFPARAERKKADARQTVQDYQTILAEYGARLQDFSLAYEKAKGDEERQKIFETKYPRQEKFAALFLKFVEANPDHGEALDALVWILANAGRSEETSKALPIVS